MGDYFQVPDGMHRCTLQHLNELFLLAGYMNVEKILKKKAAQKLRFG